MGIEKNMKSSLAKKIYLLIGILVFVMIGMCIININLIDQQKAAIGIFDRIADKLFAGRINY